MDRAKVERGNIYVTGSASMKGNTGKTLSMIFSFACLIMASAVGRASAGDYYTYRDANGNLVISNNAPPPGRKIIQTQTLPEVTDREIAEARAREEAAGLDDRLSSLEKTVRDLENLRAQSSAVNDSQQGYGESGIAVGVTNGPVIIRKPFHRPIKPSVNSKNDSPGRDPRAKAPAPPQQRPAGRTG